MESGMECFSSESLDTVAALRSRVDQQSTLIAMLKQRGDNTLSELIESQSNYKMLSGQFENLQERLSQEGLRSKELEQRFSLLAENHEEMIRIKDEYKAANLDLKARCESFLSNKCDNCVRLENELAQTRASLSECEKYRETVYSECSLFRSKIIELEKQLKEAKSVGNEQNKKLSGKIKDYEERVRQLELCCKHNEESNKQLQAQIQHLESDKDGMNKELTVQNSLVSQCEQKLRDSLDREQTMQESFRLQSDEVSKDACVKKLRCILSETKEKLSEVENDFDAYKKHSSQLLAQERELNNKLRHILD